MKRAWLLTLRNYLIGVIVCELTKSKVVHPNIFIAIQGNLMSVHQGLDEVTTHLYIVQCSSKKNFQMFVY